jgi:hypothetical protein
VIEIESFIEVFYLSASWDPFDGRALIDGGTVRIGIEYSMGPHEARQWAQTSMTYHSAWPNWNDLAAQLLPNLPHYHQTLAAVLKDHCGPIS